MPENTLRMAVVCDRHGKCTPTRGFPLDPSSKAIVQELQRTADETHVNPELVDAIESRIVAAHPIPLTGDVRLFPDELERLVHELRDVTVGTTAERPAGKLEGLVTGARKVPLTDQVRFNRRKALRLLDQVRSGFGVAGLK